MGLVRSNQEPSALKPSSLTSQLLHLSLEYVCTQKGYKSSFRIASSNTFSDRELCCISVICKLEKHFIIIFIERMNQIRHSEPSLRQRPLFPKILTLTEFAVMKNTYLEQYSHSVHIKMTL